MLNFSNISAQTYIFQINIDVDGYDAIYEDFLIQPGMADENL